MGAELPVISFIATVLALIPLPRYWRARNIPILSTITWLALCNFSSGVNSIVWAGNVVVRLHVWCDITTKLTIGASIGLSAALVCICRFLSRAASPRHAKEDAGAKRRRTYFELVMCVGLPIITMSLHVIVQANRFFIIEDFGCQPYIYLSIPAVLIIYMPPFVLSAVVMYFAGITAASFFRRRSQFMNGLHNSSGLTPGRYFRLIALCVTETSCVVAMAAYALGSNIRSIGLQKWVSWEYVHSDWYRIDQILWLLAPPDYWRNFIATWSIFPVCSLVFFVFFGFGAEANTDYQNAIHWVKTRIFRMKPKSDPVLPISGYMNTPTLNLATTTLSSVALDTASREEKWDDVPIPAYATSQPEPPSHHERKGVVASELRS